MRGYLRKTQASFTLEGAIFRHGQPYDVPAGHESKFEEHSKPEKKTKTRKEKDEVSIEITKSTGAKLEVVE